MGKNGISQKNFIELSVSGDPVETMKFEKTEAYSEFLMSLVTDTDKAIAFTKAIMPNIEGMNEKIDAEMARIQKEKAAEIGDTQKQGE